MMPNTVSTPLSIDIDCPLDDALIWRYMTFASLVAMLNHMALVFPSLREQEDKWEGVILHRVLKWIKEKYPNYDEYFRDVEIPRHYASCWHESPDESAAMWQRYGPEATAVATTVGKLKSFLEVCYIYNGDDERRGLPIKVGSVSYVDHGSWQPPSDESFDPFDAFFFKRCSFSHEREFRAIIDASDIFNNLENREAAQVILVASHENRSHHLFNLFNRVHVAQNAKVWFFDTVKSTFRKYGCPNPDQLVFRTDPESDPYM